MHVIPSYYNNFKCIASECRHNCCIGWEIDIDEDTAEYYKAVTGDFGKRLHDQIENDDPPHFILGDHDRCPFLNKDNLCDIILTLGEDHICTICTEHPRFHNELPGRIESGLGLCCEEAARIILGETDTVKLVCSGHDEVEDEIISQRDEIINILQDRKYSVSQRIYMMLDFCDADDVDMDICELVEVFMKLETLDPQWIVLLEKLRTSDVDYDRFESYMAHRQTEYEQLLVYFIYRHAANAPDEDEFRARCRFAVLAYRIIYALGAMIYAESNKFTFEDQAELARLYSSEIEYSEANTDALLDMLY